MYKQKIKRLFTNKALENKILALETAGAVGELDYLLGLAVMQFRIRRHTFGGFSFSIANIKILVSSLWQPIANAGYPSGNACKITIRLNSYKYEYECPNRMILSDSESTSEIRLLLVESLKKYINK